MPNEVSRLASYAKSMGSNPQLLQRETQQPIDGIAALAAQLIHSSPQPQKPIPYPVGSALMNTLEQLKQGGIAGTTPSFAEGGDIDERSRIMEEESGKAKRAKTHKTSRESMNQRLADVETGAAGPERTPTRTGKPSPKGAMGVRNTGMEGLFPSAEGVPVETPSIDLTPTPASEVPVAGKPSVSRAGPTQYPGKTAFGGSPANVTDHIINTGSELMAHPEINNHVAEMHAAGASPAEIGESVLAKFGHKVTPLLQKLGFKNLDEAGIAAANKVLGKSAQFIGGAAGAGLTGYNLYSTEEALRSIVNDPNTSIKQKADAINEMEMRASGTTLGGGIGSMFGPTAGLIGANLGDVGGGGLMSLGRHMAGYTPESLAEEAAKQNESRAITPEEWAARRETNPPEGHAGGGILDSIGSWVEDRLANHPKPVKGAEHKPEVPKQEEHKSEPKPEVPRQEADPEVHTQAAPKPQPTQVSQPAPQGIATTPEAQAPTTDTTQGITSTLQGPTPQEQLQGIMDIQGPGYRISPEMLQMYKDRINEQKMMTALAMLGGTGAGLSMRDRSEGMSAANLYASNAMTAGAHAADQDELGLMSAMMQNEQAPYLERGRAAQQLFHNWEQRMSAESAYNRALLGADARMYGADRSAEARATTAQRLKIGEQLQGLRVREDTIKAQIKQLTDAYVDENDPRLIKLNTELANIANEAKAYMNMDPTFAGMAGGTDMGQQAPAPQVRTMDSSGMVK